MRNKQKLSNIIILLIILVSLFSCQIYAGNNIKDMNFKGADIRDVLRAVAEVAGINLVTDGSVQGNITIHLQNISFDKALNLITQSRGLAYKWDENTVVVATPERIDDIYADLETKIVSVNDPDLSRIKNIVNGVYSEINIQLDNKNSQMILVGKKEIIEKATNLINSVKHPVEEKADSDENGELPNQETNANKEIVKEGKGKTTDNKTITVTEIIKIKNGDINIIARNLKMIYPDLKVGRNLNNYQLIIHGEEEKVENAKSLIKKLDIPPDKKEEIKKITEEASEEKDSSEEKLEKNVAKDKPERPEIVTKVIKVMYVDPAILVKNIKSIYNGLKLASHKESNQIIINGEKEEVKKAVELIDKLDVKNDETEKDIQNEEVKKEDDGEKDENNENEKEEEIVYKDSVKVKNSELQTVSKKINEIYPALEIVINELKKELIIKSKDKSKLDEAKQLVQTYDQNQIMITKMIRVDYSEIENIKGIVSKLYPGVSLQTNNTVNELVLNGTEKEVDQALKLINKLDMPRNQVIIEARIEEVSSSELSEIGVNSDNLSSIHFIKEEESGDSSLGNISGVELTWPKFLDLMKREGKAETLANPHLMTLNGEKAKMLIGQRIPVKMENSEGETSIKYIEAGITLEFKPWITENNKIELDVKPKVSSLGEEIFAGYPSIKTREVETKLRLSDGETFAIGGLLQEDKTENIAKVPVLSEIPILGEIFKSREVDTKKTELLIFITPRIVKEEIKPDKNQETTEEDKSEVEAAEEKEKEIDSGKNKVVNDKDSNIYKEYSTLTNEELKQAINNSRQKRLKNDDRLPAFLNILHAVKKGETLTKVAEYYGISSETIKMINSEKDDINEGDILTIPVPGSHLYRVEKGDTLEGIASKYNFKREKLIEINNIQKGELPVNFVLILPGTIK